MGTAHLISVLELNKKNEVNGGTLSRTLTSACVVSSGRGYRNRTIVSINEEACLPIQKGETLTDGGTPVPRTPLRGKCVCVCVSVLSYVRLIQSSTEQHCSLYAFFEQLCSRPRTACVISMSHPNMRTSAYGGTEVACSRP